MNNVKQWIIQQSSLLIYLEGGIPLLELITRSYLFHLYIPFYYKNIVYSEYHSYSYNHTIFHEKNEAIYTSFLLG